MSNPSSPPAKPPVLLLIDWQKGFDEMAAKSHRNNLEAETRGSRLLVHWREMGWPLIHVRHDSKSPKGYFFPANPGNAPMDFAAELPGETVLRKSVNSAFIGTDLEERLRKMGSPHVVVCGLTTDHCVSTSVRMGANLGFTITLVADACATFDRVDMGGAVIPAETVQQVSLASLAQEFAEVLPATTVLNRTLDVWNSEFPLAQDPLYDRSSQATGL